MFIITCTAEDVLNVREFDESKSYETISDFIEGRFDCIYLHNLGVDMWIHDEGKINNLPINALGTALWLSEFGPTDYIAGNIVITDGPDEEGKTRGLSFEKVEEILKNVVKAVDDFTTHITEEES